MLKFVKRFNEKYLPNWENHPLASEIQWERHNLFMSEVTSRMLSSIVGAVLVGLIFFQSVSTSDLYIWSIAIVVVGLNSWFIIRHHNNTPPQQLLNNITYIKHWHWLNLYMSVLWGALWGLAPFLFFSEASQVQILCLLVIVIVIVSTPSVTMACYPDIYITFLSIVFLSFGWHLVIVDFGDEWLPDFIAPFIWLSLVLFSIMIHRTHMEAIILRLEHRDSEYIAQKSNQSKTRFIAVASHDLRQPIQAARLYSEAMQMNPDLRNDTTINNLTDSLHTAGQLLDRLLDISRMDAGIVKVTKSRHRLDDTLNRLASIHAIHAQEKSLNFVLETPQLWADMDEDIVSEILDNLISNAIRYTHKGQVTLRAINLQGIINIEIEDTGIGMSESELEDAFEEFVQVNNSDQDSLGGMGLGLPIVKRLCHFHDITLSTTSKLNKGTKFTLRWPASSTLKDEESNRPIMPPSGSLRILLVEDEVQVADAMSAVLVSAGHDVIICHDLEEAQLQVQQSWQPQLLLTDDRLPDGKNALDVIHCVYEKHPGIAVLVITGNTSPERLTTLQQSNLKVLFKPMSSEKLNEAIQELLVTL